MQSISVLEKITGYQQQTSLRKSMSDAENLARDLCRHVERISKYYLRDRPVREGTGECQTKERPL